MNSLNSSKFKSTKRYRRRKVRENNKNKYGIDKNLNHQVTQKVWRLPGGPQQKQQQQQQQQQQEKYKNMHSMTSRHQERQDRQERKDDITKVKTLQDATLKASRLYGMMRDFIHPSKINYRKIHSKWRNVKKQVQVGGLPLGPGDEAGAVPVDDKDCVELPPKMSLHVTQDPLNPKQFIVTKKDGDPLINGSLTTFAEGLMGHLDKIKSGIEIDIGDADILALIAHDLISIILDVLDSDEDDDDGGDKAQKLKAALDRESRNAAAAAIIIALIGLIKKKKDGDDGSDWSSDDSLSSDDIDDGDRLLAEFRQLQDQLVQAIAHIHGIRLRSSSLEDDNAALRNEIERLTHVLNTVGARFDAWHEAEVGRINDANLREVQQFQNENQQIREALNHLHQQNEALQTHLGENAQLIDQLQTIGQQNAAQLDQLNALTQQSQLREDVLTRQIAALQQTEVRQQAIIAHQENVIEDLRHRQGASEEEKAKIRQQLTTAQGELTAARQALEENRARIAVLEGTNSDTAGQLEAATRDLAQQESRIQIIEADLAQLRSLDGDHGRDIAQKENALSQAQRQLEELQRANEEMRRDNSAQVGVLTQQYTATDSQLRAANQQVAELQQQLQNLGSTNIQERRDLEARLDEQQRVVEDLTQRLKGQDEQLTRLQEYNDTKQGELAAANESVERTRIQLSSASRQLAELHQRLESTSAQDTAARRKLEGQINDIQLEKAGLKERLDQQTDENAEVRARLEENAQRLEHQGQALKSQEQKTQQALEALKRQLTERLEKVERKILQQLPQQLQAQFRKQIERIQGAITGMTDPAAYNELNRQIADLKESIRQTIQRHAEEEQRREQEEQQRREQEARQRERSADEIKRRLNVRFRDIPEDAPGRSDIEISIERANTLQNECEITKRILLKILEIESLKIALLSENDKCKLTHNTKANSLRQLIGAIDCINATVDGINHDYERIDTMLKELRESLGDKIRTFVVLRGGDAAAAAAPGITLTPDTVKWTSVTEKTVRFSGVFDATKSNLDKYWEVKELLDNIPEIGSTVVIFGYGYSGSGKTYTLLGKKGKPNTLATQTKRRSDGLAVLKKLLAKHPVPVAASRSAEEFVARSQESVAARNASRQVIEALTAARDILKRDEKTLGVEGVTQLAIQAYIDDGCQVTLEKAFEMYNDTYQYFGGNFKYSGKTVPIDFSTQTYGTCYTPNQNITVDKFNDIYDKITMKRIDLKHIKPTPNNHESSRGHLFVQLGVSKSGRAGGGKLIMCDMGGRENPNELWTGSKWCTASDDSIFKGFESKSDSNEYFDDATGKIILKTKREGVSHDDVHPASCSALKDNITAKTTGKNGVAVNISTLKSVFSTSYSIGTDAATESIVKTLKQGFYINDSINELLAQFGYNFADHATNWGLEEYNPETRASSVSDKVKIKSIIDGFKAASDCKITFCTFACIRSEPEFYNDNIMTLDFAKKVNSCSTETAAVAAARGGAKTRRNRAQGKVRTQRRRRRIVKPKSHPLTVTTQRRNMRDKKKGRRTRKMK